MKQLYSYCIQGDVQKAYDYLLRLEKTKSIEKLTKKYYNRFFSNKPVFHYKTKDPWIKSVLKAYYEYFIGVLTKKEDINDIEQRLKTDLNNIVGDSLTDLDLLEEMLKREFEARGYYFLGGVTAPYRGPYIWKTQEKVEYNVMLPSGNKKVTVYFLTDFLLCSWLDFATFGKVGTGGWATTEALYCVRKRYEKVLDKPTFQYSYLAHEAQHFDDYEEYPKLCGKDLEYRAKLIELIYHPSNYRLMQSFTNNAVMDEASPHLYANFVLCSILMKLVYNKDFEKNTFIWKKSDQAVISQRALDLYHQHTEKLKLVGKDTVTSII